MKNLKQLLIDRKYLEAKQNILASRELLEQSVDILIECIEDARTIVLKINPVSLERLGTGCKYGKCPISDDCKHGVNNPDCEKCKGLSMHEPTYFIPDFTPKEVKITTRVCGRSRKMFDEMVELLDEPSALEKA